MQAGDPAGTRVLVFIHAFPVGVRLWEPQLDAFPGWRMMTPALPGFDGQDLIDNVSIDGPRGLPRRSGSQASLADEMHAGCLLERLRYDLCAMDLGLTDKVAIVTGSSRGIGLAIAKALAAEGCRVCVCARTEPRLREAVSEVGAVAGGSGRVLAVAADVSRPDGAQRLVSRAVEAFGAIDILVNNVGAAGGGGLLDTTDEQWQQSVDQTLFPAIRVSRLTVPHMQRRGGGAIVMIASIYGREAGGRMTYNAVKAAEISLTKSLAQQLAPSNIRVNSVSPGSILFEGGSWWKRQQADPAGIAEFLMREIPFGRFGRPEEVGDVVVFLCSPRASWISGTSIVVDGCQSRAF